MTTPNTPQSADSEPDQVEHTCETAVGTFKFLFVKVPGQNYYEIQIQESPSYDDRPSDMHTVHRKMSEIDGVTEIICLSDPAMIGSVEKAQQIAGMWADLTCGYIQTGEFPNP